MKKRRTDEGRMQKSNNRNSSVLSGLDDQSSTTKKNQDKQCHCEVTNQNRECHKVSVKHKEWLCRTCYKYLIKKKVPQTAILNGMQFPKKPDFFLLE